MKVNELYNKEGARQLLERALSNDAFIEAFLGFMTFQPDSENKLHHEINTQLFDLADQCKEKASESR